MRALFTFFLAVAFLFILVSCGPGVVYRPDPTLEIRDGATFGIDSVTNQSQYVYDPGDKDTFDIAERLKNAMKTALGKRNALSDTPDYRLVVTISYYKPGNAARSFFIGGGTPQLLARVAIYDNAGRPVGTMHSTSNDRGGIGGWARIFGLVAEEFAANLTDSSVRQANVKP